MIMQDNKLNEDDEEFRNNDFFIQFFEKFPDATMEEAKEDYKKFLDDGQSKLFISDPLKPYLYYILEARSQFLHFQVVLFDSSAVMFVLNPTPYQVNLLPYH